MFLCYKKKIKIFSQSQYKKYNKQQKFYVNYKAFSIRENKIYIKFWKQKASFR